MPVLEKIRNVLGRPVLGQTRTQTRCKQARNRANQGWPNPRSILARPTRVSSWLAQMGPIFACFCTIFGVALFCILIAPFRWLAFCLILRFFLLRFGSASSGTHPLGSGGVRSFLLGPTASIETELGGPVSNLNGLGGPVSNLNGLGGGLAQQPLILAHPTAVDTGDAKLDKELGQQQTQTDGNTTARSCPSSLSKFARGTWTSRSARGKHVIKFVQVPCPSSCPSSGSSPGGEFSYPNIFFFWLSCY